MIISFPYFSVYRNNKITLKHAMYNKISNIDHFTIYIKYIKELINGLFFLIMDL